MAVIIILQQMPIYKIQQKKMRILKVKEINSCYLVNDLMWVPKDQNNRNYQEIQRWINDGGEVEKADLFAKEKLTKIAQIKSVRDQKNIEPITDCKAYIINNSGKKTAKNSYFLFYTNRHQTTPASDPDSIISRVLNFGAMPYFTEDTNGNKITIELTSKIVKVLRQRMTERNDNNYKRSSEIEAAIRDAKTVEEIEKISWSNS